MKKGIHPNVSKAKIICSCGNVMETISSKPEIHVEVCSACHPYFTGKGDKFMDTSGRIEKFKKKYENFNFDESK